MNTSEAIDILLVEDSPGDVELVQHGLRDSKIANRIHVASDGAQAIEYLEDLVGTPGKHRPDLVLLDINLPKMNGHEVLQRMRQNEHLRSIPVVILTTSSDANDVTNAYNERANAYVQKPLGAMEFINVVKSIDNFWLTVVKLPPK